MKKILLFLYVFFCVLFIHAQIVVTNDDIAGPGANNHSRHLMRAPAHPLSPALQEPTKHGILMR